MIIGKTRYPHKYIDRVSLLADFMSEHNPFEIEYFDNPISDEVFHAISEYQDKLQKIAEDYDLDNQDLEKVQLEVNAFIKKYSDKQLKKWSK
tara:strand:+ start:274 stop:549 length:276 start_codon:yes stop_codon:yes gene_type:complete